MAAPPPCCSAAGEVVTAECQRGASVVKSVGFATGNGERVAPTFVLKYNIRTRSLADQGAIEDVLAVEDDVVPFDRADVLGAGLRPGLPW